MPRLSTLLSLALAAALALPSLTHAKPAPAEPGTPALRRDARPTAAAYTTEAPPRLSGPLTARAAIAAAIDAEIAAALADTVEVARYATLAAAVAATVTEEAKLTASDAAASDFFGLSVSLSGDRALIGVPGDNTTGPGSSFGIGRGAAYVFAFDGTAWSQEAKLTAPDAAAGDEFGSSVSLSGDRALIGSPSDKANGPGAFFGIGAAYVFGFNGTMWVPQAKLTPFDPSDPSGGAGDRFGESVSLDGDRALIGAYLDEPNGQEEAGSAYVFAFDASQPPGQRWSQEAKLIASNPSGPSVGGDQFGWAVSLSGDRALIGAYAQENANFSNPGGAYVFAFDASQPPGQQWSQQVRLIIPGDFNFGRSVSLSDDRALVGSYTFFSGSAYVFAFDGTQPPDEQWSQEAELIRSGGAPLDGFGLSVSLSGDRALVGAFGDGPGGAAYLFAFDGAAWTEQATFTASDAAPSDHFGVSVSLDGDRALVGATLDDTAAGTDAGSAYVFNLGPGAPLVADAGPDQTVVAGQTVTLDGTGSAGIGPLGYAWTLSGGATLSGAASATPSFCAAVPGTYTATLTVTDVNGSSDSDAAQVTAQSPSAVLDGIISGVAVSTQLSQTQKVALTRPLNQAKRALARGLDPTPFLDVFQAQVLGLQAQGVVTADQAAVLVGLTDSVAEAGASPCSETAGAPPTASATAAEGFGVSVYPNPSAGRTTVAFSVESATTVRLSVVDALGREVAVLREGAVEAGRHTAALGGAALPAGTYLVRLATGDGQTATERLTRLR